MKELAEAIKNNDFVLELDGIADVFFTAEYLRHLFPKNILCKQADIMLSEAFECYGEDLVLDVIEEVIESNFTKFTPKIWVQTEGYIYEEERDNLEKQSGLSIKAKFIGDYIIFVDENNKVRKPFTYLEPNIQSIINKYNVRKINEA